jgi:Spy/CpxP family protein refolding chaperone
MRKTTLLGLGLALSLSATDTVASQATRPERTRPDRADVRRGPDGDRMGRRGRPDAVLLKGITLSDDQQAKLAELRTQQQTAMEASRAKHRETMDTVRAARARGDTAAAREQMHTLRAEMEQSREQHLASIRGLLTAPQQTQFDANVAELKQRREDRGKGEGRRGRGGQRPQHRDTSSR